MERNQYRPALSVRIFPLSALGLLRRDEPAQAPAVTQPVPEPHLM